MTYDLSVGFVALFVVVLEMGLFLCHPILDGLRNLFELCVSSDKLDSELEVAHGLVGALFYKGF